MNNLFVPILAATLTWLHLGSALNQGRGNGITTVRRLIQPHPSLPLTGGVLVDKTLYLAGQIGTNADGDLGDGIVEQTRLTLENLGNVLAEVGANHSNIVKTTVLLSDINDMGQMNPIYATFFPTNQPARATFQVALVQGALIEIEAVAIVGDLFNTN